MTRVSATRIGVLAALGAVILIVSSGCAQPAPRAERGAAKLFSIGDCVAIPAQSPAVKDTLSADRVPCTADPSYTVGAVADAAGTCPSAEYQHLPTQFADPATSRLCLVPNLVANHCYVMDMPVGMLALADCAERGQEGLLVQVTQRLDVRDQQACPGAAGQYAWPYPSPPRTYCTVTIF